MKNKVGEICLNLVPAFLVSCAANFIWESLHAVYLFEDHDFHAEKYIRMISYAAAIDGLLILGIYFFIAVGWRDMLWLRGMTKKKGFTVFLLGMAISAVIECRKVFLLKAWTYNQYMPTVFGIGISPLFQLSITGMLAFWVTQRLLYQKGFYYNARQKI